MILTFIITVVIVFIIFRVTEEIAHRSVFGKPLDEVTLDRFFETTFDKYDKLNGYSTNILIRTDNWDAPYIAINRSPTQKWYIQDLGTIPKKSKWTKKLDDKRMELMMK